MSISSYKSVTSPEALRNTIGNDHYSLRWFSFLIARREVRASWAGDDAVENRYRTLSSLLWARALLVVTAGTALAVAAATRSPWGILAAGLCGAGALLTRKPFKSCVRDIGMRTVLREIGDKTLREKTLYQISEHLSRAYSIPSLVDHIYRWDYGARIVVISAGIIAACLIAVILKIDRAPFFPVFLGIVTAAYIVFHAINTISLLKTLLAPLPHKI
ncbi:MAG: hypothetical protein Q8Q08_00125 [Candidatus Omnitrophota bacterium]|nr:hypothetical protein [Candidatus Omnitrophota bacterium]MDZ4242186.1 hypothetical protein [Candidatus Omnitrophota bacterium]